MKTRKMNRWLLAGLIGAGLTTAVPTFAQPRNRTRDTQTQRERTAEERSADRQGDEYVEPIDYQKVPREARNKIDDIRKDHKVAASYLVHRNGQDNYRVTIQREKGDRVILVSDRGTVLNIEDVRGPELAAYRQNPDSWYREYDDRMLAQSRSYARQAETVTATVNNPERVQLESVPGAVRSTFMREAAGDTSKLGYIIRYRDTSGKVLYQVSMPDDRGKNNHLLQVTPDGQIFNEADFSTATGQRVDEWRPQALGYDDLPNRVKDVVDREAPKGRIPHVDEAKRRGMNIYTVQVEERDRTRYLTINEDGKILSDSSDRYDSAAAPARSSDRRER